MLDSLTVAGENITPERLERYREIYGTEDEAAVARQLLYLLKLPENLAWEHHTLDDAEMKARLERHCHMPHSRQSR